MTLVLMAWCAMAQAANRDWDQDSTSSGDSAEDTSWVEQDMALPAYPEDSHRISVPVEIADSAMEMFIDERSLMVGDDGVVRYVLVLRAPSGAENVFFEGIRCATRELRSYAYGTSRSTWQSVDTAWAPIQATGMGRYRDHLYRYYLCRPAMGALPRADMLQRLHYGAPRDLE